MIKETDIPDLSKLKKTVPIYLVASLGGFVQQKGKEFDRAIGAACRLIDKAKKEYQEVRNYIGEEERERSMTYEEIIKRNKGQYMYTPSTIDHLENCINAIARIYKLLPLMGSKYISTQSKQITDIRNTIEHIDDRIQRATVGPLAPYIQDEDLAIRLGGDSITISNLAREIRQLNEEIFKALG